MDISPISDMPNLSKRLGQAGTARVSAAMLDDTNYRKRRGQIENTIIDNMQTRKPSDKGPVPDLISGVASSASPGDKPLNVSCLYVLLQCLEVIDTRRVMNIFKINERQARRYVSACKVILPHLEKHFNQEELYVPDITYH